MSFWIIARARRSALVALWSEPHLGSDGLRGDVLTAKGSLLPLAVALTHTAYALSTGHGRRRLR